jgi:hypothetical protein
VSVKTQQEIAIELSIKTMSEVIDTPITLIWSLYVIYAWKCHPISHKYVQLLHSDKNKYIYLTILQKHLVSLLFYFFLDYATNKILPQDSHKVRRTDTDSQRTLLIWTLYQVGDFST